MLAVLKPLNFIYLYNFILSLCNEWWQIFAYYGISTLCCLLFKELRASEHKIKAAKKQNWGQTDVNKIKVNARSYHCSTFITLLLLYLQPESDNAALYISLMFTPLS